MTTAECLQLLGNIIITDSDYERINNEYPEAINAQETYGQLVARNMNIIIAYSDEERMFFKMLCDKINNRKIRQMDLESCVAFRTDSLYFNPKGELVIANAR